jgi:hypothetical protein
MTNTGVFGLSGYNDKNLEGLIADKTREAFREYGYITAGFTGNTPATRVPTSFVDRLDFSNDTQTCSLRGPLSLSRGATTAATGNSNFGYWGGGYNRPPTPGARSNVDRIDYSNDSAITSRRGDLVNPMQFCAAVGNKNFGYFQSGVNINKVDYANDLATATVRGKLITGKARTDGTGNSNFGYFGGGSPNTSTVDRIDYSNDTPTASVRGPLSLARVDIKATGNNNFGYFNGGSSPAPSTRTDRIDYSNDLVSASVRANLVTSRRRHAAYGNSNFGYFSGGYGPFPANSSTERLDYANDTSATSFRGPLSSGRGYLASTSSHSFGGSPISQYGVFAKPFGYFGGGTPGPVSTIDRIDYSSDTSVANVRNSLTSSRGYLAATGNSNFGYFGGGDGPVSRVDRIDYSNDSATASIRGPLSLGRAYFTSAGNSNFGYFIGGWVPGATARVDRIDYANDNTTASVRGSLSSARVSLAAAGTSNFSWIAGGNSANAVSSIVDRISYSNDTATSLTRGNMSFAKYYPLATGNSNFGYFGGGVIPSSPAVSSSTIDRIDYSNDTATASVRGPLSTQRGRGSATGTQNFGYFAGSGSETPLLSSIDRIDYSNDTATASVRGPLSTGRYGMGGTSPTSFGGASDFRPTQQFFDIQSMRRIEDTTSASVKKRVLGSFGYFCLQSKIDRLDYSNDTTNTSTRAPVLTTRSSSAMVGNSNFGYNCIGINPSVGNLSSVERIDFSNDSTSPSFRGSTTAASSVNGTQNSVSNLDYGYIKLNLSSINRIDFSNDSPTAKNISLTFIHTSASSGNNDFGYFGGSFSPLLSTVTRLNYSNDTGGLLIRGPLSTPRGFFSATGNNNFGYFIAGEVPGVGNISTIDRIDYSNDTTTASVRGPISVAKRRFGATGNSNFGYAGGGTGGGSTINRINYSNDLVNANTRSFITVAFIDNISATTNARNS